MFGRMTMIATALSLAPLASAGGGNLLQNAGFESVGPLGPVVEVTGYSGLGWSAAAGWGIFHNTEGTTLTELVPTTLSGGGDLMLYVETDGWANGLGQTFIPGGGGPACVEVRAWVYVVSGQVYIGAGNGGNTGPNVWSQTTGQWELLVAENIVCPANQFIIYSGDVNGAEFYVDNVSVVELACQGPPGDFNQDGFVDSIDLATLLSQWGPCDGCDADLTNDGAVNAADLAFLLGNWGCD